MWIKRNCVADQCWKLTSAQWSIILRKSSIRREIPHALVTDSDRVEAWVQSHRILTPTCNIQPSNFQRPSRKLSAVANMCSGVLQFEKVARPSNFHRKISSLESHCSTCNYKRKLGRDIQIQTTAAPLEVIRFEQCYPLSWQWTLSISQNSSNSVGPVSRLSNWAERYNCAPNITHPDTFQETKCNGSGFKRKPTCFKTELLGSLSLAASVVTSTLV